MNNYTDNAYLPDGTLLRRIFNTKRIVTVITVNAKGDTIVRQRRQDVRTTHQYYGPWEVTTGAENNTRLHTPFGYYNYTTDTHRWYLRNRQGSVMAVVDHDGNVLQRSGVYPGGTPFSVDYNAEATRSLTASTDRLHIGNRWMSHSGLNWYDNTARMHDPLLCRFTTPDALADKYPSLNPWVHCAGNPANLTDPDGNRVWSVDELGYFKLESETEFPDEERFLFIPNIGPDIADPSQSDINLFTDQDIDYLSLPRNTIVNFERIVKDNLVEDILSIRGDDNAMTLFSRICTFAKEYSSNVEFALAQTGAEGVKGLNFLTTSHKDDCSEPSMFHLFCSRLGRGYYIRTLIHSHPNDGPASDADQYFKKCVMGALIKLDANIPGFYYYKVNSKKYEILVG